MPRNANLQLQLVTIVTSLAFSFLFLPFYDFFSHKKIFILLNYSSASAADYLAPSQPPTPQVHFHSSSLSRTTTMPRGQRAAVMLTSGSGQQNQYRTFHASRYVTYIRMYVIKIHSSITVPLCSLANYN